jgi:hypothetical protein
MQERRAIFVLIVIVMTQTQRSAALNPSVEITCQQLVAFMPQTLFHSRRKQQEKGRKQNVSK